MEHQHQQQQSPKSETPQPSEAKDLGFGSKIFSKRVRMLNADGSPNVEKLGRPRFRPYDFYQTLILMDWKHFTLLVFAFYIAINLLFSAAYMMAGVDQLAGMEGQTFWENWLETFFFSAQTVTTLGYGRMAPVGIAASVIAAVESLIGLMGFALATGLLYGRFSRPEAKILFSKHALISPYEEGFGLMIRLANERSSQLIEAEAVVTATYTPRGQQKREYERLDLELDKITYLAMSWTLVHPLREDSPIFKMTEQDMHEQGFEIIVQIKAFDDSFGTTVYQRRSYIASEIRWGEKFISIIGANDRALTLDLGRISESKPVQ
jgi:inward rectifier potassium channel